MKEKQLELPFLETVKSDKTKRVSIDINEILRAKLTPPTTIIEGLLVSGESTMLCSIAGASKTFTTQYLAACISTGSRCFEWRL